MTKMMRNNVDGFIAGLKVGDRVALQKYARWNDLTRIYLYTVTAITPKRTKITLQGDGGVEVVTGSDVENLLAVTPKLLAEKVLGDKRDLLYHQIQVLNYGDMVTNNLSHKHVSLERLDEALAHTAALLEILRTGETEDE